MWLLEGAYSRSKTIHSRPFYIIIIKMRLIDYLPDVSSPAGVAFYSLFCYLIVWFLSWLFSEPITSGTRDPDVETKRKAELERLKEIGRKKREENKRIEQELR